MSAMLHLRRQKEDDVNDDLEAFRFGFDTAWRAVGRPSFGETMDLFVEAVSDSGRLEDESMRPLFEYMRTAANNGAALNWFAQVAQDIAYDEAVRRGLVARDALLKLLGPDEGAEEESTESQVAVS